MTTLHIEERHLTIHSVWGNLNLPEPTRLSSALAYPNMLQSEDFCVSATTTPPLGVGTYWQNNVLVSVRPSRPRWAGERCSAFFCVQPPKPTRCPMSATIHFSTFSCQIDQNPIIKNKLEGIISTISMLNEFIHMADKHCEQIYSTVGLGEVLENIEFELYEVRDALVRLSTASEEKPKSPFCAANPPKRNCTPKSKRYSTKTLKNRGCVGG